MSKSKLLQVEETSEKELLKGFKVILNEKFEEIKKLNDKKTVVLLSRKEVAAFFKCSLPTIDNWQRQNLITFYRKGNRKYAILSELIDSLTKINQ